jgi:hypothetical protein
MTKAYLLTWNSLRWPWTELAETARRVTAGEAVVGRWGCGRNTRIQPGDRLFLLKQGTDPRGLFASGTAVSEPFAAPHWDEEKAALCVPANYVTFQYDMLLVPGEQPILRRDLLKGHPVLGRQYWDTQASGTAIKPALLAELERLWHDFVNPLSTPLPVADPTG